MHSDHSLVTCGKTVGFCSVFYYLIVQSSEELGTSGKRRKSDAGYKPSGQVALGFLRGPSRCQMNRENAGLHRSAEMHRSLWPLTLKFVSTQCSASCIQGLHVVLVFALNVLWSTCFCFVLHVCVFHISGCSVVNTSTWSLW